MGIMSFEYPPGADARFLERRCFARAVSGAAHAVFGDDDREEALR